MIHSQQPLTEEEGVDTSSILNISSALIDKSDIQNCIGIIRKLLIFLVFRLLDRYALPDAPHFHQSPATLADVPNTYEFVGTRRQAEDWDAQAEFIIQYCIARDVLASIGARVYGRSQDTSVMTVLLKVDEIDISRVSMSELQDAIGEWGKVILCVGRPWYSGFSAQHLGARYTVKIGAGSSLGVSDRDKTGSFGGYVEFAGKICGFTCAHIFDLSRRISLDDTDHPTVQSPSSSDLTQLRAERVQGVKWKTMDVDKVKKWDSRGVYVAHRQQQLNQANFSLSEFDKISVGDRLVGSPLVSSGECTSEDEKRATLDWAIFNVSEDRRGCNEFPGHAVHDVAVRFPEMTTPLLPAVWDEDQEFVFRQDACYRGRTNGYTTGFIRSFKQYEIDDITEKRKAVVEGWNMSVMRTQRERDPVARPGDSGSWVFDIDSGYPMGQVIKGHYDEAIILDLDSCFAEVEKEMGHTVRVARTEDGVARMREIEN